MRLRGLRNSRAGLPVPRGPLRLQAGRQFLSRSRFDVVATPNSHRRFKGNIESLSALSRRIGLQLRNWALIAEPEKSDAMIEIAAAVCMVGSAQHCRDIVLSFQADNVTPASCMMYGQSELAKWTEGHPNWRIAHFTCRPAGKFANL